MNRTLKRFYMASILAGLSNNTNCPIVNTKEIPVKCHTKWKIHRFGGKKVRKYLLCWKKMLFFTQFDFSQRPIICLIHLVCIIALQNGFGHCSIPILSHSSWTTVSLGQVTKWCSEKNEFGRNVGPKN